MANEQPSTEELLGHHLKYELDMLHGTYIALLNYLGDDEKVLRNALVESFCVHARALIEFFQDNKGARKYAEDGYSPFANESHSKIEKIVQRLNNQVSHLLECRTADPAKKISGAERGDMYHLLQCEFAQFRGKLKSEYRATVAYEMPQISSGLSLLGAENSTSSAISSVTSTTL